MHCPVLYVYSCWEKSHLHFGVGLEQWGRFHELYSVVSLTLGNGSGFRLFWELAVKLQMMNGVFLLQEELTGTLGLEGTGW